MVWWSINPRIEPNDRKQAAWALSSRPEIDEYGEGYASTPAFSDSPTGLAETYNNAESLGLDLNSIGRVPLSQITYDDED